MAQTANDLFVEYDYYEEQYSGYFARQGTSRVQQPEPAHRPSETKRAAVKRAQPQSATLASIYRNASVQTKIKAFVLIALLTAAFLSRAVVNAQISDINRVIAEQQETINTNSSMIKQLNAQLNSLVSPEKIEKTAIEKLGLIKLAGSDWEYISVDEEDAVQVANGTVNTQK